MRPLGLAAVRALDMRRGLQGLVGPAHVTTRLGNLLLRNSHWFSLSALDLRRCCDKVFGVGRARPLKTGRGGRQNAPLNQKRRVFSSTSLSVFDHGRKRGEG